jgi:hypothetical protein
MSTARVNAEGETKGEEVQRLVQAALTSSDRAKKVVYVVKDTAMLTKVTIRNKLEERSDGGTAIDSG